MELLGPSLQPLAARTKSKPNQHHRSTAIPTQQQSSSLGWNEDSPEPVPPQSARAGDVWLLLSPLASHSTNSPTSAFRRRERSSKTTVKRRSNRLRRSEHG